MKKYIRILSFTFFLLMGCQITSRTPLQIANSYHRQGKFNGSLLVVRHNRVVVDTVLGYRNFDSRAGLTKTTPFYIASLAKPITALAIFINVQNGHLSLDDLAANYVDSLPGYAAEITIRQLLNHTSGLGDYENVLIKNGLTNGDVLHWLSRQQGLAFAPGTRFEYSNSGYIILAAIIEKISRMTYSQFLDKYVFGPLKMQHTIVFETGTLIPNRAIGYDGNGKVDDYAILTTGDGGIYTTVEDLYRLERALSSNQLLSSENTKLLYQTPTLLDGGNSRYGAGWYVEKMADGGLTVHHTGELAGFRSLFWRDLKDGNIIIALSNQGNAFPVFEFLDEMKKALN